MSEINKWFHSLDADKREKTISLLHTMRITHQNVSGIYLIEELTTHLIREDEAIMGREVCKKWTPDSPNFEVLQEDDGYTD
jgi:hypothetical protein